MKEFFYYKIVIVFDVMVFHYHFYRYDFRLPGRNEFISASHFCLLI